MKVVIDTNVWVSGLLWGGTPGKVLQAVKAQTDISYVSKELLLELEVTLRRPKFAKRLEQRNQTIEGLIFIATTISQLVEIDEIEVENLRDQADAKIVATAVASNSNAVITGDLDLLVLKRVRNIFVYTPAQFLSEE